MSIRARRSSYAAPYHRHFSCVGGAGRGRCRGDGRFALRLHPFRAPTRRSSELAAALPAPDGDQPAVPNAGAGGVDAETPSEADGLGHEGCNPDRPDPGRLPAQAGSRGGHRRPDHAGDGPALRLPALPAGTTATGSSGTTAAGSSSSGTGPRMSTATSSAATAISTSSGARRRCWSRVRRASPAS